MIRYMRMRQRQQTRRSPHQLDVSWGNAKYKLEDGKWKLTFANQYDQVKWKVPETIALSDVKSVTFHVADQKDPLL